MRRDEDSRYLGKEQDWNVRLWSQSRSRTYIGIVSILISGNMLTQYRAVVVVVVVVLFISLYEWKKQWWLSYR